MLAKKLKYGSGYPNVTSTCFWETEPMCLALSLRLQISRDSPLGTPIGREPLLSPQPGFVGTLMIKKSICLWPSFSSSPLPPQASSQAEAAESTWGPVWKEADGREGGGAGGGRGVWRGPAESEGHTRTQLTFSGPRGHLSAVSRCSHFSLRSEKEAPRGKCEIIFLQITFNAAVY